ncbi:hypothetical protein KUTeg_022189 [Tegillarca granosa]|uniref:Rab-GAP TBC domain-containing protein n=1 Tax=Tegillarca granosa TaxID=220873 RepID=A0ABQ9EAY8_TEGGR|nr:hypothetical protein KUTeg_022189 [Tegillarca granosa]
MLPLTSSQHQAFDHNVVDGLSGVQCDLLFTILECIDGLPGNVVDGLPGVQCDLLFTILECSRWPSWGYQTLLRIWDCFLLEGPKVLFRFALAILKIHEKEILLKSDTISIMRHLKACAKLTYDVDGLIKVAFEEIRPFPRRHDIATKQTCYINLLKEKYKKKELQRMAFAERERLYMAMEAEAGNHMSLGCAVIYENGKAWLCYGDQSVGKICKVNSEESIMYDLQLEFDARVMCISNINDVVLLGTLSWMIYTYSAKTKLTRTFAGLADGTLAVIEMMYLQQGDIEKLLPSHEVMYIPVGQAPIASLLLLDEHLWCASGNTVYIIHARTKIKE